MLYVEVLLFILFFQKLTTTTKKQQLWIEKYFMPKGFINL